MFFREMLSFPVQCEISRYLNSKGKSDPTKLKEMGLSWLLLVIRQQQQQISTVLQYW
jgi:hypothetical protein